MRRFKKGHDFRGVTWEVSKLLWPTVLGLEFSVTVKTTRASGVRFQIVADGWIPLLMRSGQEESSRGIVHFKTAIWGLQYRCPETRKMKKVAKLSAKPFLWWKNHRGLKLTRVFAAEKKPGLERDSNLPFASWGRKLTWSPKGTTRRQLRWAK